MQLRGGNIPSSRRHPRPAPRRQPRKSLSTPTNREAQQAQPTIPKSRRPALNQRVCTCLSSLPIHSPTNFPPQSHRPRRPRPSLRRLPPLHRPRPEPSPDAIPLKHFQPTRRSAAHRPAAGPGPDPDRLPPVHQPGPPRRHSPPTHRQGGRARGRGVRKD